MAMTEKMKRFADYYIETGNGAESARRAGYKGTNMNKIASENLTKLDIKEYIGDKMINKDKSRIASQDEILELLTSMARGELQERVLVGVGGGAQEFEMNTPTMRDRRAAAELLGKRHGTWTENLNITGSLVKIVDDMND